jgi:hypothetical protein
MFIGCIPKGYKVYIKNMSPHDVYIITYPSIEIRLNLKYEDKKLYDSIVAFKQSSSNEHGVYKLGANQKILLYKMIGGNIKTDIFPYESVKIIKGNDTLKISTNNIKQSINKRVKNMYYMEIH